jgi:hypothetical protein
VVVIGSACKTITIQNDLNLGFLFVDRASPHTGDHLGITVQANYYSKNKAAKRSAICFFQDIGF